MNGKDIHNAVEYVGYDLVDMAEKQRFARPFWQTALPVPTTSGNEPVPMPIGLVILQQKP